MLFKKIFLKVLVFLSVILCMNYPIIKSDNVYDKQKLNMFLDELLKGGFLGVQTDDFTINKINYSDLSTQVNSLIKDYQSIKKESITNFLKCLGSIFHLIFKQAEASQFVGPTSELINKYAVPLLIPGDFIFTPLTSLIIYNASLSDEIWKGESIDLINLSTLGNKLGTLAGKLFYDGKYDFDILFPLAFPSLRFLQKDNDNNNNSNNTPSWTKKSYQNFQNQSIFTLKKNLGNSNPNHPEEIKASIFY